MPIPLPNLDDRTFADLVAEGRSVIPRYAPEWTNYNPSDPGITLVELFAWLTELLLYRVNLVTSENIRSFLSLLHGPDWRPSGPYPEALAADVEATVRALHRRERAVSVEDFEALALAADPRVARTRCLPRRNLRTDVDAERPGHVSVIVLPHPEGLPVSRVLRIPLDGRVHTGGASSTALTGAGTQFRAQLEVGDAIEIAAVGTRVVTAILSDTSVWLDGAVVIPAPGTTATRIEEVALSGTVHTGGASSTTLTGVGTQFTAQLGVGDTITIPGVGARRVAAIASDGSVAVDTAVTLAGPEPGVDPGAAVRASLEPRRLLTTQVSVVGPRYLTLHVRASLVPLRDEIAAALKARIVDAVRRFLDPLQGGAAGRGWPFGRSVFVSELYELLDRVPGVDYVIAIDLATAEAGRLLRDAAGALIGVQIKDHELVHARMAARDVTLMAPTA